MLKALKLNSFSTVFAALIGTAASATAAYGFSYPTQWVVENQTSTSVSLTCEGETRGAGVLKDLRGLRVPAKGKTTYTWSNFYYNDGLGLNEASWYCRDTVSGSVLERFTTSWGEEVRLVLKRSGTRVSLTKF